MSKKELLLTKLTELNIKLLDEEDMPVEYKALAKKLITGLLKPVISPKELNLTYATIKYWEKRGFFLISIAKETDEWRKFSLLEYIWVQLLKKIVSMGCSIDSILPKVIFAFKYHTNPNDTVIYEHDRVEEKDALNTKLVIKFLAFVISVYEKKGRASIHLFDDNTCVFTRESGIDKINAANLAYASMYKTGISISISDILYEHENDKVKRVLRPIIFNDQEVALHKALDDKKNREVTIKQNDGKIYQLDTTEKTEITDLQTTLKRLTTEDHQDIAIKTNKNKKVFVTRTTKQNFK